MPKFIEDAFKSFPDEQLVVDVGPSTDGTSGRRIQRPALIYAAIDPDVRWLVMPVTLVRSKKA